MHMCMWIVVPLKGRRECWIPLKLGFQSVVSFQMDFVNLTLSIPNTEIVITSYSVWLFMLVLGMLDSGSCAFPTEPSPQLLNIFFFFFNFLFFQKKKLSPWGLNFQRAHGCPSCCSPWPLHKTCQNFSILLTSSYWKTTSELQVYDPSFSDQVNRKAWSSHCNK